MSLAYNNSQLNSAIMSLIKFIEEISQRFPLHAYMLTSEHRTQQIAVKFVGGLCVVTPLHMPN